MFKKKPKDSFFWSEKKARAFLHKVYDHVAETIDDVDRLAILFPSDYLSEIKFKTILRHFRFSHRQIRQAVDTIKYGRLGARISFHRRSRSRKTDGLNRSASHAVIGGTMGAAAALAIFLSPLFWVFFPLIYIFRREIFPPPQLPPGPEIYLLPQSTSSYQIKRKRHKRKKSK